MVAFGGRGLVEGRGRCGCDHMIIGFTTTCAISAYHHKVVSLNTADGEMYSIQHLCYKVFQWLVAGQWFSLGILVFSNNTTDRYDIAKILLKVALNTITLTLTLIRGRLLINLFTDLILIMKNTILNQNC